MAQRSHHVLIAPSLQRVGDCRHGCRAKWRKSGETRALNNRELFEHDMTLVEHTRESVPGSTPAGISYIPTWMRG